MSVLTVLTSQSVDRVIDIYKDFKLRNINFKFSYIFSSGAAKYNENLIIDESAYIKNIVNFFRVWIYDQDCNISVDNFQFYINMLIERGTVECLHGSCMFHYLSIDAYGNIYPCGRSYGIEYCMGNIMDFNKIDDVFSTVEYTNIIKKSIVRRNNCQAVCDLYKFCQGGCNNNALMEGGIENSGGYSCRVFKAIFIEIIKIFEEAKENLTILNPIVKKLLES
ncbi:MAG: SPASM domain-containing protein [Bacillota bacterium]